MPHVNGKVGQLLDSFQHNTLAMFYCGRGRTLSEKHHKKGLLVKQIAEIRRDVHDVNAGPLRKGVS